MASEEKHIILEANHLATGYQSKRKSTVISEHINFRIEKGTLVGLAGANGIGKSTLLRTLAGMQPALSGTMKLDGTYIEDFTPLQLATKLSIVLTEPPASKNMSVEEFISLGRQPYTNWMGSLTDDDITAITNAMNATDTLKLANRRCYELSDGQLQRVAIARALAQDTPLIILDEPTTHLDLYHRAYILKLLKKLAKETQKTILFSTHEIDLAIQLSDAMLVMTPHAIHFDTPCRLIKYGTFNTLFPEDTIGFDATTGRFSIKN